MLFNAVNKMTFADHNFAPFSTIERRFGSSSRAASGYSSRRITLRHRSSSPSSPLTRQTPLFSDAGASFAGSLPISRVGKKALSCMVRFPTRRCLRLTLAREPTSSPAGKLRRLADDPGRAAGPCSSAGAAGSL